MAKALVTGGAGFIGSHLVDALIENGDEVLVFDNLATGKRENLNPSATFVQGDVADGEQVEQHVDAFAPNTVFHLAAQADPKRAYREPAFDAMVNVRGTINIALAAARIGVNKLVFTSTGGAMYGSPDASELPVSEARPPAPASPYGLSKYCAEMYLEMLRRDHGLDYSILRPANVYGPRQDPASEVGVVLIFLELMLAGETPQMRGFGTSKTWWAPSWPPPAAAGRVRITWAPPKRWMSRPSSRGCKSGSVHRSIRSACRSSPAK